MPTPEALETAPKASAVCLTCKAGKRQCDKLLPKCSRCKRLRRSCAYPAALELPESGPNPQSHTCSPETETPFPHSCARCRTHKRRCDRLMPRCTRCSRLRTYCVYDWDQTRHQAAAPEPAHAGAPPILSEPQMALQAPVKYRAYMPGLVHIFLTSVALPSRGPSLAHHLRSEWMRAALGDPCLFHATMFSASVSTDLLRGQNMSMRTVYHQTWVIRLINERLLGREPVLTYGTLGSVVPLLYYNLVALDEESAAAHQKGLVRMLLSTPKEQRDSLGPLIAIVKIAMLSYACIFDLPPIWGCLQSEAVRPSSVLRSLVTGTLASTLPNSTMDKILDVYEAVSGLEFLLLMPAETSDESTIVAAIQHILNLNSYNTPESNAGNPSHDPGKIVSAPTSSDIGRLNACADICCTLFWHVLCIRVPTRASDCTYPTVRTAAEQIEQLLALILTVEPLFWVRRAPEALAWIAFTGAALSESAEIRRVFISRSGTVFTAVDGEDLLYLRRGWRYHLLLRRLAGLHSHPDYDAVERV